MNLGLFFENKIDCETVSFPTKSVFQGTLVRFSREVNEPHGRVRR